jgi:hypothetical protein
VCCRHRLPATRAHVQSREQGVRNGDGLADVVEVALRTKFSPVDRVYLVAGLHAVVSATAACSRQGVFPVSVPVAIRDRVQILLDGLLAHWVDVRRRYRCPVKVRAFKRDHCHRRKAR